MFDIELLKKVSLRDDYRNVFREFDSEFKEIDRLGGAHCKSCNLRQLRKLLRGMAQRLVTSNDLKARHEAFVKLHKISFPNEVDVNRNSLPYNSDRFKKLFLFKEVVDLFESEWPVKTRVLLSEISKLGFNSEELDEKYSELSEKLFGSDTFFKKLYDLLMNSGIHAKIMSNTPVCRVIQASDIVSLENKVNAFCVGKTIMSVTVTNLTSVIIYR